MWRAIIYSSLICILMIVGLVSLDLYNRKAEPFNSGSVEPSKEMDQTATSAKNATENAVKLSVVSSAEAAPVAPKKADVAVSVMIKGLRNQQGQIIVQLFDKPEAFDNNRYDQALRTLVIPAKDFKGVLNFSQLQPREHALVLFHDENNNQQFDQTGGLFEGYAYSNNTGKTSAAKFNQAAFQAGSDKQQIVHLIYH